MNDVATHLVDSVIPAVGTRQWVFSLPYSLRDRLAYDRKLLSVVLDAFIKSVFASHRRRAKERYDIKTRRPTGQRTARFGRAPEATILTPLAPSSSRSAVAVGMGLHAGVFVPGNDRKRLERICRYTARPAITTERLEQLDDGRLAYRLRTPWRDGTTHIVFEPRELMARLAALVPPPRARAATAASARSQSLRERVKSKRCSSDSIGKNNGRPDGRGHSRKATISFPNRSALAVDAPVCVIADKTIRESLNLQGIAPMNRWR